jgi:hypothetical protein
VNSNRVEVRILHPGEQTASIQRQFDGAWFVPDGPDLVFRSALPSTHTVGEHLKWFHGLLEHHRKFIRQVEASGIRCVCRVQVRAASVTVEPEALLLAHQLHLATEITFRP